MGENRRLEITPHRNENGRPKPPVKAWEVRCSSCRRAATKCNAKKTEGSEQKREGCR